ncbi:hypothetical protein AHF37_02439 [Paragonimus kellicotti]|nr:hypothetical protein AHF37_02439 [Paragonimus kellicotti]
MSFTKGLKIYLKGYLYVWLVRGSVLMYNSILGLTSLVSDLEMNIFELLFVTSESMTCRSKMFAFTANSRLNPLTASGIQRPKKWLPKRANVSQGSAQPV